MIGAPSSALSHHAFRRLLNIVYKLNELHPKPQTLHDVPVCCFVPASRYMWQTNQENVIEQTDLTHVSVIEFFPLWKETRPRTISHADANPLNDSELSKNYCEKSCSCQRLTKQLGNMSSPTDFWPLFCHQLKYYIEHTYKYYTWVQQLVQITAEADYMWPLVKFLSAQALCQHQ